MTWKLIHNNEIAGEWSDDLIDKIAEKLNSSLSKSLVLHSHQTI
jgi:hypothetical protein